jgi:hypothetical protein
VPWFLRHDEPYRANGVDRANRGHPLRYLCYLMFDTPEKLPNLTTNMTLTPCSNAALGHANAIGVNSSMFCLSVAHSNHRQQAAHDEGNDRTTEHRSEPRLSHLRRTTSMPRRLLSWHTSRRELIPWLCRAEQEFRQPRRVVRQAFLARLRQLHQTTRQKNSDQTKAQP